MKNTTVLLRLLAIQTLLLFSACVGTVQDSDIPLNSLSNESKDNIAFVGLDRGQAISDKKIELIFTPKAADPNLKYLLYINGSQSPIEISPDALDDSVGGGKRYLLDNLNINTDYKFQLKLKNTLTNAESSKEKVLVIRTFDNRTADFKGITSVKKVTGLSASSVRVDWVKAKMEGVIVTKEYDPAYYEITVIGPGGPQNLNNPNYTGVDRRVIKVPDPLLDQITPMNQSDYTTTIVDSLLPNTTYYVQVRAVNLLYYLFAIDPTLNSIPVNKEVNTKFLKIKTDPATGTFDFARDSLRLANALGADSFNKVNAFWSPGQGTFTKYRIFYRKHLNRLDTEATVLSSDSLTFTQMDNIITGVTTPSPNNGMFKDVTTSSTSSVIDQLDTYDWYQFKIVQCRNTLCLTDPINADAGIVSELRAVRVKLSLAPFEGITKIDNPKEAISKDEIKVNFDPPSLVTGYADKLEVYCLEPSSVTAGIPANYLFDSTPLTTSPRTGSSVTRCNGLYLPTEPLLTAKSLSIKGVKTIPSNTVANASYCFAVFPAIRGQTEQVPPAGIFPKADWVVRCITPEIKTPTISQFTGLTGTCSPIFNTINVTWNAPAGGIYERYKLFYRPISGSQTFKFSDAIANATAIPNPTGYTYKSISSGTSYVLAGLRPGTRYRLGILTEVMDGTTPLYSEFNTSIKDCVTPMPVATFKEWTRIFAIGPKVDGRFPNDTASGKRVIPGDAKMLEALNTDGIPYEVKLDASGNVDYGPLYYVRGPGFNDPDAPNSSFDHSFDGALGLFKDVVPVAASQNGIVSLAWKDVDLDFMEDEFQDCQRHDSVDGAISTNPECDTAAPTLRKDRKYGYKVFRSDDNRLSWKDVSGPNGTTGISLVYARNYSYHKRPPLPTDPQTPTTERMAFFTDYSVKSIFTDPEGIERGRILWYKVVPYFEKRPLVVNGTGLAGPNIIKVVLPPPNMALVKREMANRNACLDLGRETTMLTTNNNHYTCKYNGVGSRPKGSPWGMGDENLVVDLGGDLLIDRYELGCQFTRGDFVSEASSGNSFYKKSAVYGGARSELREFDGYRTLSDGTPTTDKLVGCTAGTNGAQIDASDNPTANRLPNYKQYIFGDCVGSGKGSINVTYCPNPSHTNGTSYKHPGAYNSLFLCNDNSSNATLNNPQNYVDRFSEEFRRHLMVQSEFAAVFYHRDNSGGGFVHPQGPGPVPGPGNTHVDVVNNAYGDTADLSQCQINLSAIGSDGKVRARWFPVESLDKVKSGAGKQSITKKSISEVSSDANLYDNYDYKKPTALMGGSNKRWDLTTPVSRIATANAAKIPPLTGVSQNMAQELCSTYEVEVGVSPDGVNFLASTLPMPKRLLRRHELIAGSRWPSASTYTDNKIKSLEGDNLPGSCQSSSKSSSVVTNSRGDTITPASATKNVTGIGSYNGQTMSGSSALDVLGLSTSQSSQCVSQFGLQDVVGNLSEFTTERLFCDYSKDKLYFGQHTGNPHTPSGIGQVTNSVVIQDYQELKPAFWRKAKIRFENMDGTYRVVGEGVSPYANVTWPLIDITTGFCSILDAVETNALRTPLAKSRYRDSGDNFYSIFQGGGVNVNTNIVPNRNYVDQESVNYLRNGDGFFMSFGFSNIGPQMKDSDSLSISGSGINASIKTALGPWFNPIVGFPIACRDDACAESEDNKLVTTSFLKPKLGSETADITFPIGNSQIFNTGISDYQFAGNAAFPPAWDLTNRPINSGTYVVDEVVVDKFGNYAVTPIHITEFWDNRPLERSLQQFSFVNFVLRRGTELILTNGGSYGSAQTGRFTAATINGDERSTKSTQGIGFRCGVMIDSD